MRPSRSVVLLLSQGVAAASLLGCEPAPVPAPAVTPQITAPTPQQAQMTARVMTQSDPNARTGRVAAINAAEKMCSVAGVNVDEFKLGDIVTFTGSDGSVIADGKVDSISNIHQGYRFLEISYSPAVGGGGRDPIQGDLAILFVKPKQ